MTEHHDEAHSASVFKAYMVVAAALGGFTLVSFLCNYASRPKADGGLEILSVYASFAIILAVVHPPLIFSFFSLCYSSANRYFAVILLLLARRNLVMFLLLPLALPTRSHGGFQFFLLNVCSSVFAIGEGQDKIVAEIVADRGGSH